MNNDLISRSALKKAFESWKNMDDYYHDTDCDDIPLSEAYDLIDNAPTIDTQTELTIARSQGYECGFAEGYEEGFAKGKERPTGEWIIDGHHYKCSRCGKTLAIMFSETDDDDLIGCPFCLADMRSGVCYFDGSNTWHADTGVNHGRPYLTDIIAWQPLPEPYKEIEND